MMTKDNIVNAKCSIIGVIPATTEHTGFGDHYER
jgi:hypothetical protein